MKPITLREHEVKKLLRTGTLLLVRAPLPQPDGAARFSGCDRPEPYVKGDTMPLPWPVKCSFHRLGSKLWVRETWHLCPCKGKERYCYRADGCGSVPIGAPRADAPGTWKSASQMPQWASRLTIEVVSSRAMQVQDISEDEAEAVGCEQDRYRSGYSPGTITTAVIAFRRIWDSFNTKRGLGWDVNPWVVASMCRLVDK